MLQGSQCTTQVVEGPQLLAISGAIAVVGLVEECMVCLGQQHFGRKEQAAVVVAEGWTI